jgi:hypothetical protein
MTQYAQFDPSAAQPAPVLGWYDTGAFSYPNLPPTADLVQLTSAQWTAHFANPNGWAVQGGALVAYTPPVAAPTPAQLANTALGAGLAITSTSTPALNGTYAIDNASQGKIAAISVYILTNAKFPGGVASYPLVDMSGTPHTFPTTASFQAFATAVADYVAALDAIIATNSGTLPTAAKTIA